MLSHLWSPSVAMNLLDTSENLELQKRKEQNPNNPELTPQIMIRAQTWA